MSPKYDLIKGNGFAFDGYDKYLNNITKMLKTPDTFYSMQLTVKYKTMQNDKIDDKLRGRYLEW